MRAKRELTDPDRELLRFVAGHRLATITQLAVLLATSPRAARERARRLQAESLVVIQRFPRRRSAAVFVTAAGHRRIGSPLKAARISDHQYRHDVGLGWLALAAADGRLGRLSGFVTERQMRSYDTRDRIAHGPARRFAVGLGIPGPTGQPQAHYADMLLHTASGRVVAVELELSRKSASHLDQVMLAYAAEPRLEAVLYLVADRRIGEAVIAAKRRAGLDRRVHVQLLGDSGAGSKGGQIADAELAPAQSIAGSPARAGSRARAASPARAGAWSAGQIAPANRRTREAGLEL